MNHIDELHKHFAKITQNSFANTKETLTILKLVAEKNHEELIEFLKTKFIGNFIDKDIEIEIPETKSKTVKDVLVEIEKLLKQKNIKYKGSYGEKFYDPKIIELFGDCEVVKNCQTMKLFEIPREKGTGFAINEKKFNFYSREIRHRNIHSIGEYLLAILGFIKKDYFYATEFGVKGVFEGKKSNEIFEADLIFEKEKEFLKLILWNTQDRSNSCEDYEFYGNYLFSKE